MGRLRGTRSWAQLWEPYLGLDPTLGVAQQVGGWFCVRVPEACTTRPGVSCAGVCGHVCSVVCVGISQVGEADEDVIELVNVANSCRSA